jgi:tetratricopeptide (TPR) repeat protein
MVALLAGKTHYDRARLLSAAGRARSKGRRRKAISLYRKVLRVEPGNHILRKRVACLLAQVGRLSEAHEHYRMVTAGLSQRGFDTHPIGVYREALGFLPRERDLWSGLAELQAKQEHVRDAVQTLNAGRRRFRSRRRRSDAIALLEQAHGMDRRDVDIAIDLSRLLAKAKDRPRAARVLWETIPGTRGRALRRLRMRQLILFPAPATAWRWLRAWSASERG